MSARALPVAARLSRHHLRLMRRSRDGWIELWGDSDRRRAERLSPAFLELRSKGRVIYTTIAAAGRAELARRRM